MIGQRVGHFEISALLGRGGMGEVYRARDTKLDRDVALKVLPREMSQDPERVARFQREARSLATLQHPNVASIYGFEDLPEGRFLIMELVEGEDLSRRIERGPVGVDEAIAIAEQICDGLAAAHDRGIVHRDLKPANIKLAPDGSVKILDFGLARAYTGDLDDGGDPANSPTITAAMTGAGVILGTAAYMSPEQARGRPAGQAADLWALGAILWEMLTGRRLFAGETVSDTLAGVLKTPIDTGHLPDVVPDPVRRVVARCLERDPRERFQHAGDVRWSLLETGPRRSSAPATSRWPWLVAGAAVLAAVASLVLRPEPVPVGATAPPLRKFSMPVGAGPDLVDPVFSPDGNQVAYRTDDGIMIWDLEQREPRLLAGAEGGELPCWSPDGEWIAFGSGNQILKIPAAGGRTVPVLSALSTAIDAGQLEGNPHWDEQGNITFATGQTALHKVPARGGPVEVVVPLVEGDSDFHAFAALPDGRGWVIIVHRNDQGFGNLDLARADGTREPLIEALEGGIMEVCWSPTGHIVYEAATPTPGIWAVAFSLDDLKLEGTPFLVAENGTGPAASVNGDLAFAPRRGPRPRRSRLGRSRRGATPAHRPTPELTPLPRHLSGWVEDRHRHERRGRAQHRGLRCNARRTAPGVSRSAPPGTTSRSGCPTGTRS